MADITSLECSACGANLNLAKLRGDKVVCEYCGTVNLIERATRNDQILDKQNINSGFALTATKAALHKAVLNAVAEDPCGPPDVFEKLRIVKEERICIPVFMFSISATANYMFEQGYDREKQELYSAGGQTRIKTIGYTEWISQSSAVSVTGLYFAPGSKQFADIFSYFAPNLNASKLVDIESLRLPGDVTIAPFDYPEAASYSEHVLSTVEAELKDRAESSLSGKNWRNGQMQGTNIHKDDMQRIYFPFYRIEYVYGEQTYVLYVSNDGTLTLREKAIVDPVRQERIRRFQEACNTVPRKSNGGWIALLIAACVVGVIIWGAIGGTAGFVIGNLLAVGGIVFSVIRMKQNGQEYKKARDAAITDLQNVYQEFYNRRNAFVEKKIALPGIYESVSGDESAFELT